MCVCVCMCVGGLAEKSAAVSSRPGVFESGFCVVGLASAGLGRRVLYSGLRRCHCRTAWRGLVIMSCQCFVSEAPVLFLPARKTNQKKNESTPQTLEAKNGNGALFQLSPWNNQTVKSRDFFF